MSDDSIQQWINKSRAGDHEAFKEVVICYRRQIFSYVFRIVCHEEDAKDIVQETFIKAWSFLPGYDCRYKFSTWLYTIATNCCRDYLKKSRKRPFYTADITTIAGQLKNADLEQEVINKNLAVVITQLTHQLSSVQKLVFTLKCLEGLETAEVSVITGLNADQVKGNLYLAKKNIRELLTKIAE